MRPPTLQSNQVKRTGDKITLYFNELIISILNPLVVSLNAVMNFELASHFKNQYFNKDKKK